MELEFEFEMDDLTTDIFVDGDFTEYVTEEGLLGLLDHVRKSKWFSEGNKTEGIITVTDEEVEIMWNKIFLVITNEGDVFDEVEGPFTHTYKGRMFGKRTPIYK
jgi:hypothetical protein